MRDYVWPWGVMGVLLSFSNDQCTKDKEWYHGNPISVLSEMVPVATFWD